VKDRFVESAISMLTAVPVREYAGSKTLMNYLTQRRITKMARRKELTKKQKEMIDKAFKEIDQVYVETEFGPIGLISLDEMPMQQMKKFMLSPGEQRMTHMFDFLQICLVDPNDWDRISSLPVKKINKIIQQWMAGSDSDSKEE
jgi:hypothetical protein